MQNRQSERWLKPPDKRSYTILTCTIMQTRTDMHKHTHTWTDAGPPGEATVRCSALLGLFGLLGDVSMETVMSDLQTCALPSIWLRLANQITSTHTQMNRHISSWMCRIFWDHFEIIVVLNKFLFYQHRSFRFFSPPAHTKVMDLTLGLLLCVVFRHVIAPTRWKGPASGGFDKDFN